MYVLYNVGRLRNSSTVPTGYPLNTITVYCMLGVIILIATVTPFMKPFQYSLLKVMTH